jgi:prephenate dehydrogenase
VGADVVALAPAQHDSLVAVVSHVPHLTAATLMALAADLGEEHAALLQLAAGGFRDMTRIAAGQPSIWPDICDDNAQAIVETFDLLIDALVAMRRRVADHDHASLLEILGRAATARRALADDSPRPEGMVEVRVPVPDRIGVIAEITTLATELAVSLFDIEIAHSVEGDRGVLVLVVDGHAAPALLDALTERGYRSSGTPMGPTR